MTGAQYNNIAQWTLANTPDMEAADSATAARCIFNNMGVAFPSGSCQEVLLTLMSENYMGWTPCTYRQSQEYANTGVAAIGIDASHVVVILPEDPVGEVVGSAVSKEATALAMTAPAIPDMGRMAMQYYYYQSYTTTKPFMTNTQYYNNIHATKLIPPSGGITYCNIWVHNVLNRCNIPHPTGGCTAELAAYRNGYSLWKPCHFAYAQIYANKGRAAIGITKYHVVAVTPNNIPPRTGSDPSTVGDVFVSQSGSTCFYDKSLSYAWNATDRKDVQFFFYDR